MPAEGWLKKSNFSELGESPIQASVRIEACQKQATLFMSLGIKCYSQWFAGERNQVSDALSRDDNRSDEELISVIKSFCPSQVPSHFEIFQLPKEIILWLTALLLKLPVSTQLRKVHTRSKIGCGDGGKNTPVQLESKKISSLKTSTENTDTSSLVHLPWLSWKQDFQEHLMNNWLQAQSKIPCSMYARPFEKMGTQTHPSTTTGCLHSFYSENLGRSKIRIQKKSIKKQYPSQSSVSSSTKMAQISNEPLAN